MEEETSIITGVETTPANETDGSQLKQLLKEQEEVHSLQPKEVTADKAHDWAGQGKNGNRARKTGVS